MKKYAVIWRGTVGCMSALQMKLNFPDAKVEWHYDPTIKPQAVGEGTTLTLPHLLNKALGFSGKDFNLVDAYVKTGIFKRGWSATEEEFLHDFPTPSTAIHFNANKMQDYIYGRLKDHVDLFEQRTMTVSFHTVHCEENSAIATTAPRVQTRVTKVV